MRSLHNCWMALLVAALFAGAAYAQDRSEAQSDTILFRSWRDGEYSLYLRKIDVATPDVKITDDASSDLVGTWSPDGRRRALLLYLREDDAGIPDVKITDDASSDLVCGWSPDGRRIAFLRVTGFGAPNSICMIHVMDADGSNASAVTRGARFCWSPDGTRLAFHHSGEIRVINADGTGLTRLVDDPDLRLVRGSAPAWCPDGSTIAFVADDNEKKTDLYLVNADGTNLRRLTDLGGVFGPRWSPDGATVAFTKHAHGVTGIYVISPDAGPAECIANLKPMKLDWSPDGTRITFSASDGLYTVRPDGTDLVKLLDKREIYMVDWSPDGKRIAFDVAQEGLLHVESIYIINADGTDLMKLTHSNLDGCPHWAPRIGDVDDGRDG